MTITVEVTQEDIARGERGACSRCPVALAIYRATGLGWNVYVRATAPWHYAAALAPDYSHVVDLPFDADCFVADFDDRTPVQPFSFDLHLPDTIVAAMKDKVKA